MPLALILVALLLSLIEQIQAGGKSLLTWAVTCLAARAALAASAAAMNRVIFDLSSMSSFDRLAWDLNLTPSWQKKPKPTREELDGSPFTRPLGRPCPEPSDRRLVD